MSGFGSSSFGASAFGAGAAAGGGSPVFTEELADALTLADAARITGTTERAAAALALLASAGATEIREQAAEALVLSGAVLDFDLPNLVATLNLTGSIAGYGILNGQLLQAATFSDAVQAAWELLLQENIALAGAATGNRFLLGAVVDTLHAVGAASTRLDAVSAVAAAMAMEALIANGYSVSAMDSVDFNDALDTAVRMVGPLVDSASLGDSATNAARLVVIASESAVLADSLSTALTMPVDLADTALLYATINLGGVEYAGWVLNTESKAPSQYTNFAFESLVSAAQGRFRGRTFGAGEGGIFEIAGDTDDGAAIPAYIKTGLLDFASSLRKRNPDVWIGQTGEGQIVLKVVHRADSGELVEDWYLQDPSPGAAPRTGHIAVGKGLRSRVYGFTFHNKDGGSLNLSSIELRRLILERR